MSGSAGELEVVILGCGSSGGVPRGDGDWGDCDPAEPRNRRSRCSALIRGHGPDGVTSVLIDTSPDLRAQMLAAQVRHIDAVLYTHDHADQTHGIDDLRVFAMRARRRIPAFMDEGLAAMRKVLPSCRPVPFGHVGDGNLHFNCMAPVGWDKARFMAAAPAISAAVYDLVVKFGGSISAEHGIGRMKVEELAHYRGKVELDTMRAIKRALDPANLMNPGKVLEV